MVRKTDNFIHHTAIIGNHVLIGKGNYIGPYCVLQNCTLGDNNRLEAFVSIGTRPEHKKYWDTDDNAEVTIGDSNVFREFVTINAGTERKTTIESNVVFLRGSHAGHDSIIRNYANISCNVMIGGHSIIGEKANIGLAAVIHQWKVIGSYAMVGMNSTVTKHVLPFTTTFGSPAKAKGINGVGLTRNGWTDKDVESFEMWLMEIEEEMISELTDITEVADKFLDSKAIKELTMFYSDCVSMDLD